MFKRSEFNAFLYLLRWNEEREVLSPSTTQQSKSWPISTGRPILAMYIGLCGYYPIINITHEQRRLSQENKINE